MATYRKADPEAFQIMHQLVEEHYPALVEAKAKIEMLFAFAPVSEKTNEPTGPAIRHHGWPACAVVKVNSLKDRVAGLADARIVIDGDKWPEWDDGRRRAIIDHELYHLEVRRDGAGRAMTDDAHRPKLRLGPHDWQLGGFDEIINRHGRAAVEAEAAIALNQRLTQAEFSWG